nr:MAG TPA: hypothetical protein [Caudoviricetes sp.]
MFHLCLVYFLRIYPVPCIPPSSYIHWKLSVYEVI